MEPVDPREVAAGLRRLAPLPARRRRRRRLRRTLLVAATLAAAAPLVLARPAEAPAGSHPAATTATATRNTPAVEAVTFARVGEVDLVLPSPRYRLVAFHEASYPDSLPLVPVGRMVANHNPTKFTSPPPSAGPAYTVMSSRGRAQSATSAADIVVAEGTAVAAVVSGTVTTVEPYLLYGRHPDTKVEIVPEARPDLRVALIHVADVRVEVGQRVVAGATVVAGEANAFPFASHADSYLPGVRLPHVHVEVKSAAGAVR